MLELNSDERLVDGELPNNAAVDEITSKLDSLLNLVMAVSAVPVLR
jgi:hypothetical protein